MEGDGVTTLGGAARTACEGAFPHAPAGVLPDMLLVLLIKGAFQ